LPLPALEQRAGKAELGCDADRHVVLVPRRDHPLHPRPRGLPVGGMDPVEAQPGALLHLPFQLVGLADHRGGGDAEAGLARRAGQAGAGRQGGVIAGVPAGCAHAHHRAEGVGQVVGQLAAAARAGEAGEEGARKGTGVQAARLRVAERVLGEGGRGGSAEQRVGVGEGGVEPEQDGEGRTPPVGRRNGLAVEDGPLDPSGGGRDVRIRHPILALGAKFSGIEPIEQLTEEIGVVLLHT
jgi:hypothetical protein